MKHLDTAKRIVNGKSNLLLRFVPLALMLLIHSAAMAQMSPEQYDRARNSVRQYSTPLREDVLRKLRAGEKVQLDLYVMSQCPFGVLGQRSMANLVHEFGNKIEVKLNYIANEEMSNGAAKFNSMHGQGEVEEDIRQLLIARDHPEKLWSYIEERAKNFQHENWQTAATAAGIDVKELSAATASADAAQLLRENMKLAQHLNIAASPTLYINGVPYNGPIFDEAMLSDGTLFQRNRPAVTDMAMLITNPFSPFPEAAAPEPSPLAAPPPPIPPACTTGSDPFTGANYVVCTSSATSAWISSVGAGTYHSLYICNSLGYASVGSYGGTCGNVCGYCTSTTSCSSPGAQVFDGGGSMSPDLYGPRLCCTVQWQCVGALSNAAPTFPGGSPQSMTLCQNSAATSINSLLAANDADAGQTLTWTVTSSPSHGTLSGVASYTATSTGGTITPSGMTYTPTSGYSGTDAFTIQVSDGAATASTTINVTINPLPAAIATSGSSSTTFNYTGGVQTYTVPAGVTSLTVQLYGAQGGRSEDCSSTLIDDGGLGGLATGVLAVTPGQVLNIYVGGKPTTALGVGSAVGGFNGGGISGQYAGGGGGASDIRVGGTALTDRVIVAGGGGGGNTGCPNTGTGGCGGGTTGCTGLAFLSFTPGGGGSQVAGGAAGSSPGVAGGLGVGGNSGGYHVSGGGGGYYGGGSSYAAGGGGGSSYIGGVTGGSTTAGVQSGNGQVIISYSFSTGSVCVGNTTTLSTTPSGGTWSSSSGNVTVNSTTGGVTGVAAGTATITYTLSTGCYTTAVVTVNPLPAAITTSGSSTTFNYTGSVQTYTVPAGVTSVTVLAKGGQGGNAGGLGAIMQGDISVTPGQVLKVLVGGQGTMDGTGGCKDGTSGRGYGAGGGGGSFVTTSTNTPLVVAGGGGGLVCTAGAGINASTATSGNNGVSPAVPSNYGIGGTGGAGATNNSFGPCAGNGAGINSNGQPNSGCGGSSGIAFVSGGAGGTGSFGNGGFGGGGAGGNFGGGGGGGYSGGGGSYHTPGYAGGGGSYNSGTSQVNSVGNTGDGQVIISYSFSPGSICVGNTTTLTTTPSGGAWSTTSGNVTVNSTTGGVTGVAAGTATITYTLSTGCYTTAVVTVNALPTISGNTTLSTAITTTLSASPSGGTWLSVSTGVATIGSSSGVVTGVSVGTSVISYTSPGSCVSTTTVNVLAPQVGLSFDGTDDHISLPTGLTSSYSNFTFETWVYPTSNVAWQRVMDFGSNTNVNMFLTNSYDGAGTPRFAITTSSVGGEQRLTSSTSIPLNTWSHIAVTINGSTNTGTLYINGNVVATNAGMTLNPASLGSLTNNWLGRSQYADPYFAGKEDEVRIWNTVRTQSQIQADMNCDVPQNSNLKAYYRFNEGIASGTNTGIVNAYDYSGNGFCGALNNFAKTGSTSNYVTGAVGSCNTITITTPAAITGNAPVCVSSTITLANANTGGVWTSGNTGIATVNSTSGLVTGVAAGTVNVTYTLNCAITSVVVTVNPRPVPSFTTIPSSSVCVGDLVTYATQPSQFSYIWNVPGTAGVDYSIISGGIGGTNSMVMIKWVTAGVKTVTVNYTDINGCTGAAAASNTTTVNPLPTAITGTGTICVGQTTTLSSTPAGGTWTSSNTGIATVNPSTGVVTGVSGGTVFITYTLTTGCHIMRGVVVNPLPVIAPTNTSPACVGGFVSLNAGGSGSGVVYAWTGPSGFTSSLANPGMSGITLARAGTYTLTATAATGCSLVGTTTVTVNPVPTTTPTNTSPVCVGGTVNFNAVATAVGTITYSWTGPASFSSASPTPSRSSVTSTHAGAYIITVSTPGSGCITSATTIVTINPTPGAAPTNSSPVCAGSMVTLYANPIAGTGVTGYSWSGPGGFTSTLANPTVTPAGSGTYSLTVTSGSGSGCSPSTIFTTAVTVNPMPTAITTGGGSSSTFAFSGSIQSYTVPAGVTTMTITASGAQGGGSGFGPASGGLGANMSGTFTVVPGHVLSIIAGGQGSPSGYGCGGGGGGSFVWDVTAGNTLLIAAGGGGGAGNDFGFGTPISGVNANTTNNGTNGGGTGVGGGTGGNGGVTSGYVYLASGGAGWLSNGSSSPNYGCFYTSTGGVMPLSGGAGGSSGGGGSYPGNGGFGGGGGGNGRCNNVGGGGGGGYSGGAGGGDNGGSLFYPGGGGGSYNIGSAQVNSVGNTGNGIVTITYSLPSGAVCVGNTTTLSSTPAGGTWTSGSPTIATVGATTGVVTGVSAGTSTISYTLSTGCGVSTVVTVNPNPAAIAGTAIMCVGASTTLTNTTSGGTWSSSNTAIATVGSSTGVVTGVAAGTADITYSMPTGCFAVRTVTVNGLPGTITGTMSRCVAASATLSSSPGGGTWTSSNTLIATVGSTSGTYTGVSAGVANITYTLSTGCYTTASVTINPNPAAITGVMAICAGSTTTLASTTSGGTWSSGSPSVATVGASTGIVSGSLPGTTVITYQLSTGCSVSAIVTVNTMPTSIASVPAICVGSTTTLSSTPGGGTWSSSDPSMATVSGSGVVTGISAGVPVITYAIGSCYVTRAVTVNPNPATITGIMVVCMGSSTSLFNATAGGTWTSGSTGIATVGATTGLVTGVSAGTANITYTLGTGCFAFATVTVNTTPTPITGTMVYCVGNTGTLTATPAGGTWSSSSTTMATVSGSGVISALAAGTPVITYSFGTGCMRTAMITVNPNPAAITGTTSVCIGAITTLSNSTSGGTWSSSTPSVATVGSTGIVTGAIAGTTTISYTLPTGCYATTTVTVLALPVISSWSGALCVSSTTTLTATPAGGTWSSSNTGVATIGAGSGVVTGISAGTANLTYTSSTGCVAVTAVTVNGLPTIATWPGTLCVSSTATLTATPAGGTWTSGSGSASITSSTGVITGVSAGTAPITYTLPTGCMAITTATVNGLPTTITGNVPVCVGNSATLGSTPTGGTWTSGNVGVATVVSSTGVATGVSAGTAVMTYTLPTGCIVTAVFTVNPLPPAITGITNVCTGFTTALFNASAGGTWSSSNTALGTVSTSGVVTGIAAGTLTITYTLPTGCFITTPFTVNPTPTAVTGTRTVCVGLTTTLSSTPSGGTWTSSNTAEATVVGATGMVTGVSAGIPVMTYTLATGCKVTTTVTVNPLPTISGASLVCTSTSIALAATPAGGLWSSSSGAATVGSTSGVVTGVSASTVTITYTLPTGCIATKSITVNPNPTAITGTLTVCTGLTTTLNSTPAGGTWTSSNTAEATIGSTTGVATGLTAGMPVMTYTLSTGCFTTAILTVNPTPPANTGSNQVCVGLTTTLANSLAGGTWSSSNTAFATVGATTGIVTGIAAGTLNITYMMPTGCFAVTAMTVNALPSSITGTAAICPGTTTLLSSSPTGGVWTSSNTAIATVGSSSGLVTGVAGGTVTITYTLATGCTTTMVVTVNPAPNLASFSLPTATSPCVGGSSTVTLNSTTIGSGTYTITYNLTGANTSSGNTATVNISSSTGTFVIPAALLPLTGAQNAVITSVTNSFGCITTLSSGNVASFNVNVLPTVFTVTGGGGYCAGGTGVSIGLSGSTVGVNYQLFLGATAVGAPVAGTSTALTFGTFTTAGTYTVVATNATTACVSNMSGSATVIINPLPTAFTITGGGSYCAGGTGVTVGLGGSQSGVNYQLYVGSTPAGTAVSGTGGSITFGLQTTAGTYTIVATNATTGCVNTMSGFVTVVVNPVPTTFTGASVLCVGATTTLASTPTGGTWTSTSSGVASIGSTSGFVTGLVGGTTTISYTLSTGCFRTSVITINPNPASITGTMNVCVGSTITLSSTTTGGTWTSSNTALATVGSSSGVVTGVSAGTLTITYTISTGCFTTANVTVNPVPAAISGASTVCTGLTVTLSNTTIGGTWSSSASGIASVTSSGVVSGVLAGTANITYALSTGCNAVFPMTVNPTPASITGTMNVCVGSTRNVSSTTTGGVWSSSNTSLANVGSSSGIVTGMAAGTVTITYMMPTGCFTTTPFTVNPIPAAITGSNNVCQGSTVALSNTTSGGTWSSSASGTASVTSTGVVTGAAVGTATITYTIPGGCFAIFPVTVNSNPASITGTASVCVAASTTLASTTTGGLWTSSNPTVAAVGGATGVVTGIAAGTATISYTVSTGCFATRVVTVNPNPASIAGPTNVCTGLSITLANATTGGTWSSSNALLGSVNPTSGVVTGIAVGTPIISYTLGTGCFATYAVVVNQSPDPIGGPSFVCVGSTITATNTYAGGTWSSSNATLASVGSTTGIITGNAVGLPVITYSLPPGCIATTVISVNPIPGTITGTLAVCVGSTTSLGNSVGGGTWSSGSTAIASVSASTGMVTGGSAGTANITYTLPGGCFTVAVVTVNPLPAAIGGANNVCAGSTTTLTNTSAGGTWTSSIPTLATIGTSSGIVTGLAAGTLTITYTLPTGCYITMPFTVNPLPATITGTAVVCVNATTNLSDATAGGTWSSSSTSVATIGSTGVVTGISGGNATITYMLPTGCFVTRTVTVNALPSLYSISGGGGFCTGGSGVTIGLSGSNTGIRYQLYNGSTPIGSPVTGTGASISFGLITIAGTYTVVATNITTGCFVTMTGSTTVFGIALPTPYTVTGGGTYCVGGSGFAVGLASSQTGVNYQLYNGATVMGAPVAGTGGAISFGTQTMAGTYTVVATNGSGCVSGMSGSVNIIVNPLPTAFTVTGGGAYCTGGTGTAIGLSSSTTGVNYQLFRGGTLVTTVAGTGSSISFGSMTTVGTYTVVAINATTSCTNNMIGSAVVVVNPLPTASYTVGGGGTLCAGATGVNVTLSGSDVGVNYQMQLSGSPIGSPMAGTGSSLNFGPQTAAGNYTIRGTSSSTGCVATMTGSVNVVVNPLPTVFTITGGGSYCFGSTAPTIGLSGSQTGVSYQLIRDGITVVTTVSGTGSSISFGVQSTAGTYTVVATSTAGCVSTMSGSTVVAVNPLPTAFTVAGGGGYCAGGSGVAVTLSGSQSGVNYQLNNTSGAVGSPVSGTGAAISFGLQTVASTYTVVATNAVSGCTANMTGSVVVSVNPLPTAYAVTGGGAYCAGGTGAVVGLANSQTNVRYQLYLGTTAMGSPVSGTTGSAITFGPQSATGTYTVVATNTITGCVNNMTGSVTVSVTSLPSVYLVTGGGAYCAGGTGVAIGLSGSQTGVNYQLYNGMTAVGTPLAGTGSVLSYGLVTAAGTYTVVANVTGSCSNNMLGSVVVAINPLPTAYTVTGGGSYCVGGTGVNVGLSSSSTGVSYQLMRGTTLVGLPVAGTGIAIDFGLMTVAGTYTVVATNTGTGCVATMTGSVNVATSALPITYTVTGGGSFCSGSTGVTVGLGGSQTGIKYQLYVGTTAVGSLVTGTGSAISFGTQTTAGTYTVIATDTTSFCTRNMTGSVTITVNPLPNTFAVSGGGTFCAGSTGASIGLTGTQTGVRYQLFNGSTAVGSPVNGTGSSISFGTFTTAGTYTVVATNTTTLCTRTMTGSATIVVNPLPTVVSITGGGSYCAGSSGVHIGLAGSAVGVNYQLYRGSTSVGAPLAGIGAALDFGLFTTTGTYTVIAVDASTGCTRTMSGSVTVSISTLPTAFSVTGGGSYCAGGTGVTIGLSGSSSGVTYQLYRGTTAVGSPVSGTGSARSFGLQTTAGTYTVVAVNATTGCTNNMTGSATVSITSAPAVYTVTGGGSYCVGSTGLSIGLSGSTTGVSYQLYRGTSPVGSPLAGTGSALSFGIFTTAGTYTVVAIGTGSCTSTMTGSATITVNALPTVYSVTGGGSYCAGGSGLSVGLSNSASGVNYQLYRAGSAVGTPVAGTGSTISFGLQTVAGSYTVVATNATTGCTSNMTGSVTITVNSAPTAFTVTGGGAYCSGPGYHIYLSGSQTGVSYRLYLGSTPVGAPVTGTGAAIDFGSFTTVGTYTVIASSTSSSCTTTMTGSASITSGSLPTSFSVTGGGSMCVGGTGFSIGLSGSQSGVNYQLYRGTATVGTPVAGTGSAISFGTFTTAGGYTVVATNATTGCIRAMSGSATITVNALPTAYTVTGGGSYCSGGSGVTIGLSSSATGVSYKLYRSSTLVTTVAGTGSAISFGLQTTAGTYTVTAMTTSTGCTNSMTGSATVTVNTTPTISGSIYTVAPASSIALTGSPTGGTWTSSSTSVATVGSSSGVVTGVSLGTTTITYTITSTSCRGTHTVAVTPTGHRGTPGASGVVVNDPITDIHVVPNPNQGVFSIKGSFNRQEDIDVTLEMTNMLGQVIYSGKVIAKNGELDEVIHLNGSIANGMYLLNVTSSGDGKVFHIIVEK